MAYNGEIWDKIYQMLARIQKLENELNAANKKIGRLQHRTSELEKKAERRNR